MITKEYQAEKTCVFYASEYHLEMILLPYIIKKEKVIIFTEKPLEKTLYKLLEKINLNKENKEKIIKIKWQAQENSNYEKLKKYVEKDRNLTIIINGSINYIKTINNKIKDFDNKKIEIIDCY